MRLPEICIRRPVLALVLSLLLVIVGLTGFDRLELRFFPKVTLPVVTVDASYQGASAELMESQVTTLIESALSSIDNIQSIASASRVGASTITVQFNPGGDFQTETNQVRNKVFALRDKLPALMTMPVINVGSNAPPILGIGFIDPKKAPIDVRAYLRDNVMPSLRQTVGVGAVTVLGSYDFAMRIWLKPIEMAARSVTASDIKMALVANNVYFSGGAFSTPQRRYGIVANTLLQQPKDFLNIIISASGTAVTRLSDVATVSFESSSLQAAPLRINGVDGVELTISPLQDANPIAVAHRIKAQLSTLAAGLPPMMRAAVNYDGSLFLQSAINETLKALVLAVVLVVLVTMLFLGSLRAALIPIITIPVSLIGVFMVLELMHFSINTMSLLAMVLAIGLVVDDAIVVLENIYQKIQLKKPPMQAAIEGVREIAWPVVVMTLTLVAVFLPIGLIRGVTSVLFQQFAFTLAGAVCISGFVALTLSPMMCAYMLKYVAPTAGVSSILERLFHRMTAFYVRHLSKMLQRPHPVFIAALLCALIGAAQMWWLPSDWLPKEDTGVVNVSVLCPSGANVDYTIAGAKKVEAQIKSLPAVDSVVTQIWSSGTNVFVTLKPWGQRRMKTDQVVEVLNRQFSRIPEVTAFAYQPDIAGVGQNTGGSDVVVQWMTSADYPSLLAQISAVLPAFKKNPLFTKVTSSLTYDAQQYALTIHRDLAANLGVSMDAITDTASTMMSGGHWTDIQSNNKSYAVLVQMDKLQLRDFDAFNNIYVRSLEHFMVPLSTLVQLRPVVGQSSLDHYNRFRSGAISLGLARGVTESQGIKAVEAVLKSVIHGPDRYAFSGKAAQYLTSSGALQRLFLLSFIFIYLVLSAQFESFIDPLVILVPAPLALAGALMPLTLLDSGLSIYVQIGLLTLIGLISKHGILLVQFITMARDSGVSVRQAVLDAAKTRLRPIVMTTMAMVFGVLPLALAQGPGSIGRMQIGWVLVGGLINGTLFSLVVVPTLYYRVAIMRGRMRKSVL